MKIESIIRRKDGTRVDLGGVHYHFRPEVDGGPHVATVENSEHIARFLSIPEGYRAVAFAPPLPDEQDVVRRGPGRPRKHPYPDPGVA